MLEKNTKVRVTMDAKFHAGRVGWLAFYTEAPNEGTAVIREEPEQGKFNRYFCVDIDQLEEVE